jgi:glyoxalase family protein
MITGIHHITALASSARQNVEFYTRTLGLRLVKRTVNFDAPDTYHLYYGDEGGNPGSILTFFPYEGLVRGRRGVGQMSAIRFAVAPSSLDFWKARLHELNIPFGPVSDLEGTPALRFEDPDGMQLEVIASLGDIRPGFATEGVPAEHAIKGFHSAVLQEKSLALTGAVLKDQLGMRQTLAIGNMTRFVAGNGGPGAIVDILETPDVAWAHQGAGSVHHLAFRTPTDETELAVRAVIEKTGISVTPVIDRNYFHSVYFREPGGVLFEIATDPPGFAVDEPAETMGSKLMLPPWLEPKRAKMAAELPNID